MNFFKMKNKKIFFFAFISFFIVGCNSIGDVTLTDTKGNKYTFKNESVTCEQAGKYGGVFCEGSAIKRDIAGNRYATEFSSEVCIYMTTDGLSEEIQDDFICAAAKELGKLYFF